MINRKGPRVGRFIARGIGADLEEIRLFKNILNNKNFMRKVFTDNEVKYCRRFSSPEAHLAVRFAGKEAVFKALSAAGIPANDIDFKKIEILTRRNKAPFVDISRIGAGDKITCLISLTHSKKNAMAFAIAGENI